MAMAMGTVAAGPDGGQELASPTGDPGAKPGGDQAAKHRRGARYWLKAAGVVLGVVVWALLVRIVLGSGPGDTGGHDGGPGPSTVTRR